MASDVSLGLPAPCGHPEIAERFLTSECRVVFCSRCQRHYESPPDTAFDAQYVPEALAYTLL